MHDVPSIPRFIEHWQRRLRIAATRTALQGLDARALRDLGFDRSEIASVAEEAAGRIERQRRFLPYY